MAVKTYSDKLKDPRWQKKRLEIFKRDKFTCKACGDNETTLNVHHKEYSNGEPWEIENKLLITLCEHCHSEIEILDSKKDINWNTFKVYKSNTWESGSRIMFTPDTHNRVVSMTIYDPSGKFVIGFNLDNEIFDEIKKVYKRI